jgi:hypothetical protein
VQLFCRREDREEAAETAEIEGLVTIFEKVEALLADIELDSFGEARAAIALMLAAKLDEAAGDHNGAVAMAVAGISKELRAVIDSILEITAEDDDFVAGLYAGVGDS